MGGHGYSSPLVCLFVYFESTHLDVTALRLQHGLVFTQVISFNSGRFGVKALCRIKASKS